MTPCVETDWPRNHKGYGRRKRAGGFAYRVAWAAIHGPIPAGLVVMHRCDNPPCVNVGHLTLGTPSDNAKDRHAKGRDARGHRNGVHKAPPLGERNGQARLTEAAVREIREAAAQGVPGSHMAARYGVHATTVQRVIKGTNWPIAAAADACRAALEAR